MRAKIHKWFWSWDFEKEEKWLNEMAAQGLVLISVGFCTYYFEENNESEYTIRLEMLENSPSHVQSIKYIQFLEETGAEYLGSVIHWVYFRKKKEKGVFELYSDYPAKIKHLSRISNLMLPLAVINLVNGFNNLYLGLKNDFIGNIVVGILAFSVSILLFTGSYKISKKRNILKKEAQLYE